MVDNPAHADALFGDTPGAIWSWPLRRDEQPGATILSSPDCPTGINADAPICPMSFHGSDNLTQYNQGRTVTGWRQQHNSHWKGRCHCDVCVSEWEQVSEWKRLIGAVLESVVWLGRLETDPAAITSAVADTSIALQVLRSQRLNISRIRTSVNNPPSRRDGAVLPSGELCGDVADRLEAAVDNPELTSTLQAWHLREICRHRAEVVRWQQRTPGNATAQISSQERAEQTERCAAIWHKLTELVVVVAPTAIPRTHRQLWAPDSEDAVEVPALAALEQLCRRPTLAAGAPEWQHLVVDMLAGRTSFDLTAADVELAFEAAQGICDTVAAHRGGIRAS